MHVSIIAFTPVISFLFQVCNDLGDHVWQDKCATISDLGDGFRPLLSKGWLAYIKKAYPAGADAHNTAIGQTKSVVAEAELAGWILQIPA